MKVGLIDVDSHNFPNLALMKLSAYHKAAGDSVEWWYALEQYDRVYMSKVFDNTYSPDIPEPMNAREIIKGGTGYGLENKLPYEIEHIYPDYSLTDATEKADKFNTDKLRLKMYPEGSYYSIEELTDDLKGYHSIRTD